MPINSNYNPQAVEARRAKAATEFGNFRMADAKTISRMLDIGLSTFRGLTRRKNFPKPVRMGRVSRWWLPDVLAWATKQTAAGAEENSTAKEAHA